MVDQSPDAPQKPEQNSAFHDDLLKYWDTANAKSRNYKIRFRSKERSLDPAIERTHRDFTQIVMTVWFQPSVQQYRTLLQDTDISLKRSSIWVVASWGLQLLLAFCLFTLIGPEQLTEMQGGEAAAEDGEGELNILSVLCSVIICLPILVGLGLLIYVGLTIGIPHSAARILGGEGILEETAFLYGAIYVPSSIFGMLLNLMWQGSNSVVILVILLPFSLYSLGLQVVAIRSAHRLNWLSSTVSVLVLPILVLGIVFIVGLLS